MRDVVAALAFGGFVALGWAATSLRARSTGVRQRYISWFVVYTLFTSFTVGIVQRDLYPFVSWPLVAGTIPDEVTLSRITVVDRTGVEYLADGRAWEPLSSNELHGWLPRFLEMDRARQDSAASFLLRKANAAAARVHEDRVIGSFRARLGPLTAPLFLLVPATWRDSTSIPRELIGIRIYIDHWNVHERAQRAGAVTAELVFEYELHP